MDRQQCRKSMLLSGVMRKDIVNRMVLPERLLAIANQVPACEAMADIGCDHGYLPIYLLQSGRVSRAVAMDIHRGPLEQALLHIEKYGMASCIELRQSDGLAKLRPGEVQAVVIAGMGGMLIKDILEKADPRVLDSLETLVLQPQTEADQVRRILHEKGFRIVDEMMVEDRGKRYVICRAEHGQECYADNLEYQYGRLLYEKRDPVFYKLLIQRSERLMQWMGSMRSAEQRPAMEQELLWIRTRLQDWQGKSRIKGNTST